MIADPAAVKKGVKGRPALHRYVETVPDLLVAAAEHVLREYEGDAYQIWNDHPRAIDLHQRLEAFKGIGQKKAAMAVEILEPVLGVPIRAMHGNAIT